MYESLSRHIQKIKTIMYYKNHKEILMEVCRLYVGCTLYYNVSVIDISAVDGDINFWCGVFSMYIYTHMTHITPIWLYRVIRIVR